MAETQATAADHPSHGQGAHEDHGIKRYVIVFLALLFFTGLTWWTGRQDFGAANLPIALLIATTKSTLVVLFFMHLYDDSAVNRLVFVMSVFFALVLLLGTFGDLWFRLTTLLPTGVPGPWDVR